MFSVFFSFQFSVATLVLFLTFLDAPTLSDAHAVMLFPNQRGALRPRSPYLYKPVPGAENSQVDWWMHFPAGDKSPTPGSEIRSQDRAAGPAGWVPYEPYDPKCRFRAGLCGDKLDGNDHLKDGKFYDGGNISRNFTSGPVLGIVMGVDAHHNGF